jgi:hypothetical protein
VKGFVVKLVVIEHPDPESGNTWTEVVCPQKFREVLLMIGECRPHGEDAVWFNGTRWDFEHALADLKKKAGALLSVSV